MDDDQPRPRRSAPMALIISIITAVVALAAITIAFFAGLFRFSGTLGSSEPTTPSRNDDSSTSDHGAPGAGESARPPSGNDPTELDTNADDGESLQSCGDDVSCDNTTCDGPTCDTGDSGCTSGGTIISAGVSAMSILPLVTVDHLGPKRSLQPRATVSLPARCARVAIDGYRRWISPHTSTRCRFVPNCSAYGRAAITRYGLANGSRLALRRVRRCTPVVPMRTSDPPP